MAIDNFLEKLKFTYVGSEISTECTFGSATFSSREYRYLIRASYAAWDGPSEYVFNTIQQELSVRMYDIINSS